MTHETALWLSKTAGLFYLLAMSAGVLVYVFWPANKSRFDAAALRRVRTDFAEISAAFVGA